MGVRKGLQGPDGPPPVDPAHSRTPPRGDAPRYIHACHEGRWHLRLFDWRKIDPKTGEPKEKRIAFRCRSWRHEGECQKWRAKNNFARIAKALEHARRLDVVFLVLTFGQGNEHCRQYRDRYEAFDELKNRWRSFRKALDRKFGKAGYASTVEVHPGTGWPHLNVVIHSPALGQALGERASHNRVWLKRRAQACGFGFIVSAERCKNKKKLAGYIVKVAGRLDKAVSNLTGEVVKKSQVPADAPRYFRRLRSSRGFLPPTFKSDEEITGVLEKTPIPRKYDADVAESSGRRDISVIDSPGNGPDNAGDSQRGQFAHEDRGPPGQLQFRIFSQPADRPLGDFLVAGAEPRSTHVDRPN